MTVLDTPSPIIPVRFRPVVLDLYRNIHKASVANCSPSPATPAPGPERRLWSRRARRAGALGRAAAGGSRRDRGRSTSDPCSKRTCPASPSGSPTITTRSIDCVAGLWSLAEEVRSVPGPRNAAVHELYIELASFTGTYLLHQDFEEREINPALEETIGVDEMVRIHEAIIATMEPQELIQRPGRDVAGDEHRRPRRAPRRDARERTRAGVRGGLEPRRLGPHAVRPSRRRTAARDRLSPVTVLELIAHLVRLPRR